MQQKIFCIREFIKTESATAVQRAFRLHVNIQPPVRKSICRWNHQFEQIGCLCKGKSSGRPRVSEENVRWIQESFEHSPRKSTHRVSRELGIPQPTVWRVLRCRLLFNWVHLFDPFCISVGSSTCFRCWHPSSGALYNCNYSLWHWSTAMNKMLCYQYIHCSWPRPEAVITVLQAPDDGCQHPIHTGLPTEL